MNEASTKVQTMLASHRKALQELTERLMSKEVIGSEELHEVMEQLPGDGELTASNTTPNERGDQKHLTD